MSRDPIDQALRNEAEITPSPGFPHRVMRSVRQEADRRQAIPFPWTPLVGGLALAAGLTLAAMISSGAPAAPALAAPPAHLASALGWLTATLAASLGVAWWSVRFAGR